MMQLTNTIDKMLSDDYKERFQAEYWQTKIRYEKLRKILMKYEAGTFGTTCPVIRLREQLRIMAAYLDYLEIRAELEDVNIDEDCWNRQI